VEPSHRVAITRDSRGSAMTLLIGGGTGDSIPLALPG
jgi:hypothetical protein